VGNTVMACLGVVMTSGFFFLSLYLQQILGYSALRTGVAIVPITVLLAAGPLAAKRLLPRFGPRFLILAGGILTTAGVAWMSQLPDHSDYPARILGPMLVIAVGIGLMLLPLAASAMAGIETRYAGLASGLFNTARQLGGAIGLAVLVTIAATVTRHSHLASPAAATVHGYRIALLISAAVSLASVLIGFFLPTPAKTVPATRTARPARPQSSECGAARIVAKNVSLKSARRFIPDALRCARTATRGYVPGQAQRGVVGDVLAGRSR
jgi:MFS family permease